MTDVYADKASGIPSSLSLPSSSSSSGDAQSYKLRHENFVSGLTGGPIDEIYLVTLVAVSAYVTWCVLQSKLGLFTESKKWSYLSLLVDLSLNWLGILASITIYASSPALLNALILAPILALALMKSKGKAWSSRKVPRPKRSDDSTNSEGKLESSSLSSSPSSSSASASSSYSASSTKEYLPKQSFLTNYRGAMMIITCLAILAVDFRIFPRKLAKVETWGTSLMDLGVGSFVFSMGLVSSRTTLIDTFLGRSRSSRISALWESLHASIPVLSLGLIRLFAVKYLDYQEHVTEYGVHWNFFMTLGLLPPFVAVVGFLPKRIPTLAVSWLIAACYELLLDNTNLGAFVLTAPRTDLISQNKEGICSFVGYLAIFLAGKSTGYYTLPSVVSFNAFLFPQTREQYITAGGVMVSSTTSASSVPVRRRSSRFTVVKLLIFSSIINNFLLYVVSFWLTPSRRLVNLPYVLWVISYNTGYLSIYVLAETLLLPPNISYENSVPLSCEAVNSNGLTIFLLANITTGLININVKTLDSSRELSFGILVLYASFLFIVSVLLYQRGIRIKI